MVFEEEDFQLAMYGYRLNPEISEQRICGLLRDVEAELNEMIHTKSNVPSLEVILPFLHNFGNFSMQIITR